MGSKQEQQLQDVTNTHGLGPVQHVFESGQTNSKSRLVITASGFHGQAKQELQQLVDNIGAVYSGSLVHGITTHLVCKRLIDCFATPKYQKALEWGIQIVTYDWLLASNAVGKPLQEDGYRDDMLESLKPSPRPAKRQQQLLRQPQPSQHAVSLRQEPTPAVGNDEAPSPAACHSTVQARPGKTPAAAAAAAVAPTYSTAASPQHIVQQQRPQGITPCWQQQQQCLPLQSQTEHQQRHQIQGRLDYDVQLSQHSPQQPQQPHCGDEKDRAMLQPTFNEQQQQQSPEQLHVGSLGSTCKPAEDWAGSQLFHFAAFDVDLASPSVQHFLPLQQQQQQQECNPCVPGSTQQPTPLPPPQLDPLLLPDSELQPAGLADIAPAAVVAANVEDTCKQLSLLEKHSPSGQGSHSILDTPCCAQHPCSPRSPAAGARGLPASTSPAGNVCPDKLSPTSLAMSAEGLLIPETQVELEDPWGCGSASPPGSRGTPLSLKYYAMQQCSKAHTACTAAQQDGACNSTEKGTATHAVRSGVHSAAAAIEGEDDLLHQQDSDEEQGDDGDDETTADETESDQQETEQQQQQQQQHKACSFDRPVSAVSCSSSSQPCQQQQHPSLVFRQTSSSKSGSSTGLTRLQRRDGYKRQANRLLELSDPELQDSDCELEDELCDSDYELQDELPYHGREVDRRAVQQARMHPSSHQQQLLEQQRATNRHSPVHSCSGSSLPACSITYSAGGACAPDGDECGGDDSAAVKRDAGAVLGVSAAAGAAVTPAAWQVTSSDSGMPVMKLSFPLGTSCASVSGSSWCCEQPDGFCSAGSDSAATPQCTCDSSNYGTSASSGSSSMRDPGNSRPQSGSSSAEGVSRNSSSSSRRLLRLSRRGAVSNEATAAAMMDKRQQLKQQQQKSKLQQIDSTHMQEKHVHQGCQQEEEEEEADEGKDAVCNASPFPCPLSAVSNFITKRRNGRQNGAAGDREGQAADAATTATTAAVPVMVKMEPLDAEAAPSDCPDLLLHAQQQCQEQQVGLKLEQTGPADALLQAMRQQQQQQQQQEEEKRQLVSTVHVKQEQLDPAEQLLQNLKRQQQQQQPTRVEVHDAGAGSGTHRNEAIEDDNQHLRAWQQQQQHVKPGRCSAASSFATELSTVSAKVPLRIVGDGQQLDCSSVGMGASPLERMLQVALAEKAAAAAAAALPAASPAAATGVECKQEPVAWLHTPEEQQQGQQHRSGAAHDVDDEATDSDEDSDFEITGMPTKALAARNKPIIQQLGAHLAHLSQTGGQEQVIALKLLGKAPRGSTAKAFHGIKPSSKLVYADQVQVPWARATFSTKERCRCIIVLEQQQKPVTANADAEDDASSNAASHQQQQGKAFLAEPVAFYRLESGLLLAAAGEWWVEMLRFYSAKDLRLLAKAADQKLHLPSDFQLSYELLRGMAHEHVPVRQIQGEFKLSKVRKVPASGRNRVTPFFWRYSFDSSTCQVLTDRPVTDFLVQ